MNNIEFKITKNTLSVGILKKDEPKVNLNDTNIIDTKDMVFSLAYIEVNLELVASFLNVIVLKKNVNKVIIKDYEIILLILKLLNSIPYIEELVVKPDKKINYQIFMALLSNKSLKRIDVYDIPHYLLDRLDTNKDLEVNVRSEILFISEFMAANKFNSYSDLYYAKSVIINYEFSVEDYEDIRTFMDINKHLKTIQIHHFVADVFIHIASLLKEFKKENVKIVLKEENNDLASIYKVVGNLKKRNEKFYKENEINFRIHYSAEFKRKNIFKQLNLNFIRISTLSVILLIIFLMGLNAYKNYVHEKDIKSIEDDIRNILNMIDREQEDLSQNDPTIEFIEPDNGRPTTTRSNWQSVYYRNLSRVWDSLLRMNSDTVGWITVHNTRIDYPVVQGRDNDFYLRRDFNRNRNSMGWIFMDYRNNIDVLNQNTIIYGHNINGGIMFGTLRYALNSTWYRRPENQIITFNTLNASMKWQIFSIYRTPPVTDYLVATFFDRNNYEQFLTKLTRRSIHNFNIPLTSDDRILTLSTCTNRGNERLVVHAVLIRDEEPDESQEVSRS
jgi:sortase B